MKPIHEQEWSDRDGVVDMDKARGTCVVVYATLLERRRVATAIAALPDMARALLALVEKEGPCVRYRAPTECGECIACRARAALKKAGVLR